MTTLSDEKGAAASSSSGVAVGDAGERQVARARANSDGTPPADAAAVTPGDGESRAEAAGAAIRSAARAIWTHPARWGAWDHRPRSARVIAREMRAHPWWDHDAGAARWLIRVAGVSLLAWHVLTGMLQAAPRSRAFWCLTVAGLLAWLAW